MQWYGKVCLLWGLSEIYKEYTSTYVSYMVQVIRIAGVLLHGVGVMRAIYLSADSCIWDCLN